VDCCLRCAQSTVYLLENVDVILCKLSEDDIKADILPMIFTTLESNSLTLQVAFYTQCLSITDTAARSSCQIEVAS